MKPTWKWIERAVSMGPWKCNGGFMYLLYVQTLCSAQPPDLICFCRDVRQTKWPGHFHCSGSTMFPIRGLKPPAWGLAAAGTDNYWLCRLWDIRTWVMRSSRNSGLREYSHRLYFSVNYFSLKTFFFQGFTSPENVALRKWRLLQACCLR